MGFIQVGFSVLLLFVVQLSTAQWPGMGSHRGPAGFQFNKQGWYPWHTNDEFLQWLRSGDHVGSPDLASIGVQLPTPSADLTENPVSPLRWLFPTAPQFSNPPAHPNHQHHPHALSVSVQCNEATVHVEVRRELFLIHPNFNISALTLGGCAATGLNNTSQAIIYESELHGCNSKLYMTESELVYVFTLGATAVPLSGTPIIRGVSINVPIECHYPRFFNVSSSALLPAFIPFSSAQAAEEQLVFSLRVMNDDWTSERPFDSYYLGDLINIEASVQQFNHVPLRVLIDGCVATPVPDPNAVPRYSFIENHGCLIDGKLTQSSSYFMPQAHANKLGFRIEAFLFQQGNHSWIYISCILKAIAAASPPDARHKACSFSDHRWTAAYGSDDVCRCCDSTCSSRKRRKPSSNRGFQVERKVSLGPIMVMENAW